MKSKNEMKYVYPKKVKIAAIVAAVAVLLVITELLLYNLGPVMLHHEDIVTGENSTVFVSREEAKEIKNMMNTKSFSGAFPTTCGYDMNVAVTIGFRHYRVAMDGCTGLSLPIGTSFDISDANMEKLHSIFEKYDMHFPCI